MAEDQQWVEEWDAVAAHLARLRNWSDAHAAARRRTVERERDALARALLRWTHEYTSAGLATYCAVVVGTRPSDICAQQPNALVHDTPRKILAVLS